MHPVMLKKHHFEALVKKQDQDSRKEWRKALKQKLVEMAERIHKKDTLSHVTWNQREDREDEQPVNADAPPLLITGDQIQRYKNLSAMQSFLGPYNINTGCIEPMRLDPGTSEHHEQVAIPFLTRRPELPCIPSWHIFHRASQPPAPGDGFRHRGHDCPAP